MSPFATALFEGALVGSFAPNYEAKSGPTFGGLTRLAKIRVNKSLEFIQRQMEREGQHPKQMEMGI